MSAFSQQTFHPDRVGQLVFNSKDMIPGGYINDYWMNVNLPVWKVNRVVFNEISMPMTWYTFNDGSYNGPINNNIIFMEQGNATIFTASIPKGNYSTYPNSGLTGFITLQDQVTSSMNGAGGTGIYTCGYNYNTSIITISSTINFSILWSKPNDCAKQLGFKNIDTGYAASQSGYGPIQITNSGCMYLSFKGLDIPAVITSSQNPASGQMAICVASTSNNLYTYKNDGTLPKLLCTNVDNSIKVSVTDGDGKLIPLNVNWSISFILFGE